MNQHASRRPLAKVMFLLGSLAVSNTGCKQRNFNTTDQTQGNFQFNFTSPGAM